VSAFGLLAMTGGVAEGGDGQQKEPPGCGVGAKYVADPAGDGKRCCRQLQRQDEAD